jgi:hypothetical protein
MSPVRPVTYVSGPDNLLDGGAGGIRTLDRALQPYNGLANRRLQPLGHSSMRADMPDAGARRKRQMWIAQGHLMAMTDGGTRRARLVSRWGAAAGLPLSTAE